jgi:hypothetical protein
MVAAFAGATAAQPIISAIAAKAIFCTNFPLQSTVAPSLPRRSGGAQEAVD